MVAFFFPPKIFSSPKEKKMNNRILKSERKKTSVATQKDILSLGRKMMILVSLLGHSKSKRGISVDFCPQSSQVQESRHSASRELWSMCIQLLPH